MSKLHGFRRVVLLVACACTSLSVFNSTTAEPAQKRDPFQLPAQAAVDGAVPQASADGVPVSPSAEQAPPAAPLRLRAVIYDGARSLVNINGRILAVGEVLDEGHRLVRVGERDALLVKNGKELRLHMAGGVH